MGDPRRTRRSFLKALAGGAVAGAAAALAQRSVNAEARPNLLYVFSDQHRAVSLPGEPYSNIIAPNMERLAREGVRFVNCISNYPVCSPHRAMLITGKWPYHSGVIDNNIRVVSDGNSIGDVFARAGYRTGYVGKWHLQGKSGIYQPPGPARHGFEWWRVWYRTNAHWDKSFYYEDSPDAVRQPKGYNATLMVGQAIEFIKTNRGQRWCLFVSLNPPHPNFLDAPEEQKKLYPVEELKLRPNVPRAGLRRKNFREIFQGYCAHISAVDRELGRLLDALDETGQAKNTLVVYSADHGEMMGSQGRFGKRLPFEESCRVPFFARWPGKIPAGHVAHTLLGTIDIFPSLCGLVGLEIPSTCDGRDLSAAFLGKPLREPESQFLMHIDKHHASGGVRHPAPIFRGVRTTRYTYAYLRSGPWVLYDNEEDPFQQRNLVNDPGYRKLREELHALVQEWLKKADDPGDLTIA